MKTNKTILAIIFLATAGGIATFLYSGYFSYLYSGADIGYRAADVYKTDDAARTLLMFLQQKFGINGPYPNPESVCRVSSFQELRNCYDKGENWWDTLDGSKYCPTKSGAGFKLSYPDPSGGNASLAIGVDKNSDLLPCK